GGTSGTAGISGSGGALAGGGASGLGGAGGGKPFVPSFITGTFDGRAEEFRESVSATFGGSSAILSGSRSTGGTTETIILSLIAGGVIMSAGDTYDCMGGSAT